MWAAALGKDTGVLFETAGQRNRVYQHHDRIMFGCVCHRAAVVVMRYTDGGMTTHTLTLITDTHTHTHRHTRAGAVVRLRGQTLEELLQLTQGTATASGHVIIIITPHQQLVLGEHALGQQGLKQRLQEHCAAQASTRQHKT